MNTICTSPWKLMGKLARKVASCWGNSSPPTLSPNSSAIMLCWQHAHPHIPLCTFWSLPFLLCTPMHSPWSVPLCTLHSCTVPLAHPLTLNYTQSSSFNYCTVLLNRTLAHTLVPSDILPVSIFWQWLFNFNHTLNRNTRCTSIFLKEAWYFHRDESMTTYLLLDLYATEATIWILLEMAVFTYINKWNYSDWLSVHVYC